MEYILLIILWGLVGWVYLLNLASSEALDEMSEKQRNIVYIIFLPTTLVVELIILMTKVVKEIKKYGKNKQ